MIRFKASLVLAAALALAGCVSLLPRGKPVQLYRFGAPAAAAFAPSAPGTERIGLMLSHIDMQRAASGDQILAVTGEQAAFVGGARWLSPASALFEAAVEDGFAARSTSVRLLDRAEFAAARGTLRLDVPAFETRYGATGTAPTVRVHVRAMLTHRTSAFAAAHDISAEVPASENRVSAIVAAYDAAVGQAVSELVTWTDANAGLASASVRAEPGTSSSTSSGVRHP